MVPGGGRGRLPSPPPHQRPFLSLRTATSRAVSDQMYGINRSFPWQGPVLPENLNLLKCLILTPRAIILDLSLSKILSWLFSRHLGCLP
jgi:hypothetical protein